MGMLPSKIKLQGLGFGLEGRELVVDGFADKVTREVEESGNERLELSGVESTSR